MAYTDNTSPTLEECLAVETFNNTFINDYYDARVAEYPEIDLTKINLDASNTAIRNGDGTTVKHATTNEVMFTAEDENSDPIAIPMTVLIALRLKSHVFSTTDGEITFIDDFLYNPRFPNKLIIGALICHIPIEDGTENMPDGTTASWKGIKTQIAEGTVKIRTHDANGFGFGRKEIICEGNPD